MICKIAVFWHWLIRLNFDGSFEFKWHILSQCIVLNAVLVCCRLVLLGKSATIGRINKWSYECKLMDGVTIHALLPKKWLMKSLVYRGALHLCSEAWHSEIWTNITVLSCFIFQFGGLELCFGGDKPTKAPPW